MEKLAQSADEYVSPATVRLLTRLLLLSALVGGGAAVMTISRAHKKMRDKIKQLMAEEADDPLLRPLEAPVSDIASTSANRRRRSESLPGGHPALLKSGQKTPGELTRLERGIYDLLNKYPSISEPLPIYAGLFLLGTTLGSHTLVSSILQTLLEEEDKKRVERARKKLQKEFSKQAQLLHWAAALSALIYAAWLPIFLRKFSEGGTLNPEDIVTQKLLLTRYGSPEPVLLGPQELPKRKKKKEDERWI